MNILLLVDTPGATTWQSAAYTAAGGIAVWGVGKVAAFLSGLKKNDAKIIEIRAVDTKDAATMFKSRLEAVEVQLEESRHAEESCRERNTQLTIELAETKAELKDTQATVQRLNLRVSELEKRV